jgi:hypothetical protein
MARVHWLAFAVLALGAAAAEGAELPSQVKSAKPPEHAQNLKKCNIGGNPGFVTADGVCVRISGSVSAGFGGGQIK